jgi:hypothetical protein
MAPAVASCRREVRAGLVGVATMATGGAVGAWSEGAGLALGAGEGGSAVLGAALGGAAGNVGVQLAGDTFRLLRPDLRQRWTCQRRHGARRPRRLRDVLVWSALRFDLRMRCFGCIYCRREIELECWSAEREDR